MGSGLSNPNKDYEIANPSDDSISSLAFSPATIQQNFLVSGAWDNNVRCWEIDNTGKSIPKAQQTMGGPILDVCWDDMGTKVFMASCDKQVESPLKYQHRCVSIFKDKKNAPTGFALGSVEGRVAIQYVNAVNPKDNFTFKCHRSTGAVNGFQDIFAVNDITFHPVHGTLSTVGSDGRFSFWDKDARTKLKTSEACEQPITKSAFNKDGQIFAYAVSYDWSKGHEFYNTQKKNYIFLRSCFEELKPRQKT